MRLYAKIGSGPGEMIQVKYRRKPPRAGDLIRFKSYPYDKHAKWRLGRVDRVDQEIYFMSLA